MSTTTGETARGGSQHTQVDVSDIDASLEIPGEIEDLLALPSESEAGDEDIEIDEPIMRWERNASLRKEYLELAEAARSFQAEGDAEALAEVTQKQQRVMDTFWEENKGLALKIARKFRRLQGGNEDYTQDAVEGLVVAFHRWDPARSTFATFCQSFIKGKVNRGFNTLEYGDRSYGDHTAAPRVHSAQNELFLSLGRKPTHAEIAELSGFTKGVVDRVLTGKALRLDAPIHEEGRTWGDELADTLGADSSSLADENPAKIVELLKLLTPRELWTIICRDGLAHAEPMTLAAISAELAEGRESLRRDEKSARDKMKAYLDNGSLPSQATLTLS